MFQDQYILACPVQLARINSGDLLQSPRQGRVACCFFVYEYKQRKRLTSFRS